MKEIRDLMIKEDLTLRDLSKGAKINVTRLSTLESNIKEPTPEELSSILSFVLGKWQELKRVPSSKRVFN